jgi:hypothetical protein
MWCYVLSATDAFLLEAHYDEANQLTKPMLPPVDAIS